MPTPPSHKFPIAPLLWLLLAVFLIGLFTMPREEYIADPMVVRCESVSIINNGSLAVPSEVAKAFGGDKGQYFVENPVDGKWYSKYGVLNGIMNVPPLLVEKWMEGKLPYSSPTRVIYLNTFNLFLAVASAAYLYLIASRYTRAIPVIIGFVLACLYCTYWWYYLRAQNSEIYQTLFMLGFYYHLTSFFKSRESKEPAKKGENWPLLIAGLYLGAMILAKTVYLALVPLAFLAVFAAVAAEARSRFQWSSPQTYRAMIKPALWIGVPLLCALCALLAANAHKFGSPFESGYSQWQERYKPIFSGNLLKGILGFFFRPQYSIFLCFPVLVFALFGYWPFFKNHRLDTLLFTCVWLMLLGINSKLLEWPGGWGYGPRYMLVTLPLLSLPFIWILEFTLNNWRKWWVASAGAIIAITLLYSLKLQVDMNSLPFFAFFRLQGIFAAFHNSEIDDYFNYRPRPLINGDLIAFKKGEPWRVLELAKPYLNPATRDRVREVILPFCSSNYYFWPDPNTPVPGR